MPIFEMIYPDVLSSSCQIVCWCGYGLKFSGDYKYFLSDRLPVSIP